jgi:hypothetical protein
MYRTIHICKFLIDSVELKIRFSKNLNRMFIKVNMVKAMKSLELLQEKVIMKKII